ncbi:MAG: hypothetical protein LC104_18225 [Bacteroidales bacterium]|nr:hypothetical protein [Bacteroidales bacterium]
MSTRKVECGSCGQSWTRTGTSSIYEQQAVESRPCPQCGAYTLRTAEMRPVLRRPRLAQYFSRSVRFAS